MLFLLKWDIKNIIYIKIFICRKYTIYYYLHLQIFFYIYKSQHYFFFSFFNFEIFTNQFVKKVGRKTKICCTRKTTPNLRLLDKYAVKKGGGYNHRFNLSDEILIKENHISSESSLRKLIIKALKTKKIVTVEIENIEQLKQVLG